MYGIIKIKQNREGRMSDMEKLKESDEELLKEYEWAEKHVPDDVIPKPKPGEFERIWKQIREEREKKD